MNRFSTANFSIPQSLGEVRDRILLLVFYHNEFNPRQMFFLMTIELAKKCSGGEISIEIIIELDNDKKR